MKTSENRNYLTLLKTGCVKEIDLKTKCNLTRAEVENFVRGSDNLTLKTIRKIANECGLTIGQLMEDYQ